MTEQHHTNIVDTYDDASVVIATVDHAKKLAPKLRHYDCIEVGAFLTDNEEALMDGLENDDKTYTVLDRNGEPFVMFGVGVDNNQPYIWLLGSKGIEENALKFAKHSKKLLPELIKPYGVVSNLVYKDYGSSIKWLKWLGAKFITEVEINGYLFYEFIITSK